MTKNKLKTILMDVLDAMIDNYMCYGHSEAEAIEYVCRIAGITIKEYDIIMSE